jgi:hypothetical protein
MRTKCWLQNLKGREHETTGHRCEDNIKMVLRLIRWEDVDWMHPIQDRDQWRFVNAVMNLRVP